MEPVTMMNPVQAIRAFYAQTFVINGRTSRAGYWWVYLYSLVVGIPILVLSSATPDIGTNVLLAWLAIHVIPTFTLMIRRLHDGGSSGWTALVGFVPLIGGLILLAFLIKESELGVNDWGASWDMVENTKRSLE